MIGSVRESGGVKKGEIGRYKVEKNKTEIER